MKTTRVGVLAVLAVAAVGVATVGMQPASAQPGGRHQVDGSRPAWQSNPNFKKTGTIDEAKHVTAKSGSPARTAPAWPRSPSRSAIRQAPTTATTSRTTST
jgi:hypothetical protein